MTTMTRTMENNKTKTVVATGLFLLVTLVIFTSTKLTRYAGVNSSLATLRELELSVPLQLQYHNTDLRFQQQQQQQQQQQPHTAVYQHVSSSLGKTRLQERNPTTTTTTTTTNNNSNTASAKLSLSSSSSSSFRILYIVTTSGKQYGNNDSRWNDLIVPVVSTSINSYYTNNNNKDNNNEASIDADADTDTNKNTNGSMNYAVDLYVISAYAITRTERTALRDRLPSTVGIQYWTDAVPYTYKCRTYHNEPCATTFDHCKHHTTHDTDRGPFTAPQHQTRLRLSMMSLARQHRYVLKDKVPYYDFFVSMEDDMMVKESHVQHHRSMMQQLRTTIQQRTAHLQQQQQQQQLEAHPQQDRPRTDVQRLRSGGFVHRDEPQPALSLDQQQQQQQQQHQQLRSKFGSQKNATAIVSVTPNVERRRQHRDIDVQYLKRLRPGFVRVEVLQPPKTQQKQQPGGVAVSSHDDGSHDNTNDDNDDHNNSYGMIDPKLCCWIRNNETTTTISSTTIMSNNSSSNGDNTATTTTSVQHSKQHQQQFTSVINPSPRDLVLWETNILGFRIRPSVFRRTNNNNNNNNTSSSASASWIAATTTGINALEFPAYMTYEIANTLIRDNTDVVVATTNNNTNNNSTQTSSNTKYRSTTFDRPKNESGKLMAQSGYVLLSLLIFLFDGTGIS